MDLTLERQKKIVTDKYREVIATILEDVVTHTPQFTGNLAQAWEIEFGIHSATGQQKYTAQDRLIKFYKYTRDQYRPFVRGQNPAVGEALSRELPKLESLRWNSVVKVVNRLEYSDEVEEGIGPESPSTGDINEIRPENLYRGKVFMANYAAMKYSNPKYLVKIVKK
jgi:hypothetical protein